MIRSLMLRGGPALLVLACGCGYHSGQSAAREGAAAFREKDYPRAIAAYTRATKRITDSPELYYNLGRVHWVEGNLEPAQAAFQAAVDLRPGYGDALEGLGAIAYYQKEFARAEACQRQALAAATNDAARANVWNALGLTEAARGRHDQARLALLRALRAAPRYAPAYYNVASLFRDHYNLREEALDNFELYVRLADPKEEHHEKAANNIKRLRLNLERTRAEELDGVRRDPATAAKLLQEGARQHAARQYARAIKAYKESLAADPFTFSAAFGLGMAYKALGQRAESAEAFKRAAEISPNHQDSYWQAGEQLLQLRQTAEAAKALDRAIARSPFNPLNMELMARIRHAEGRYDEARAYGEFYLALLPPGDRSRGPYEKWVNSLPAKPVAAP